MAAGVAGADEGDGGCPGGEQECGAERTAEVVWRAGRPDARRGRVPGQCDFGDQQVGERPGLAESAAERRRGEQPGPGDLRPGGRGISPR
ncbi:MAG: hypothetical protein WAK82_20945 [Streptosporangiaceae bacterium]